MKLTSQAVEQCTQGKFLLNPGPLVFTGVEIDSRKVKPGDLFIALPGQKVDGHSFVEAARNQGAAAAVVQEFVSTELPLLWVSDTLAALQEIALLHRKTLSGPLVAITGSVGKTTTKEVLAQLLSCHYQVLKTEGNFNNEIGVPLTLLRLTQEYTAAVVEMGMRAPGEIAALASLALPDYGIITNVEAVHLETMGSLAAIAAAKCELLNAVSPAGFCLVHGDNPLLLETAYASRNMIYTFGSTARCDVRLLSVSTSAAGIQIEADLFGTPMTTFFSVPSPRLAMNVIAAAGLAYKMGIGVAEIQAALSLFQSGGARLHIEPLPEGGLVINDTYNANPVSMQAALETLAAVSEGRRKVAVLGDMFELGEYALAGHRLVGKKAAALAVDVLVTVGDLASNIGLTAIEQGLLPEKVHMFAEPEAGAAWLRKNVSFQDAVLFKASRGMKLENLLQAWRSGGMGL